MSQVIESRLEQQVVVESEESSNSHARVTKIKTPHGEFETPIFMPVGTQGTVKGVLHHQLLEMDAEVILGNTYHLWLRPGEELLREMGGLRKWCGWERPLLTDSGGFQVFSLSEFRKIVDDGVHFKSHLDGRALFLSPEKSIEVQEAIGSTIMMVLDVCPALPAPKEKIQEAMRLSTAWAERSLLARTPLEDPQQGGALFAIVQGGLDLELRLAHLAELQNIQVEDLRGEIQSFDGFALGGFSVGEPPEHMHRLLPDIVPKMPKDKPRYLMGVGTPTDLLHAISAGIDMFDCVMPTRNARNGGLFTWDGSINIRNDKYKLNDGPIEEGCSCLACRSRVNARHSCCLVAL